jgi:glycosyltransferase involved in cell wall biosynthesis
VKSLVSILVPTYNAAPYVAETIASALEQTWSRKEVIVVDDGSTDDTLQVASRFASKEVNVVSLEHQGASAARNVGLRLAQGDYIQFLDGDDLLEQHKLERQLAKLSDSGPRAVSTCSWTRFRAAGERIRPVPEPVWRDTTGADFLIRSWLGGGMMPNFAWLTPRAVVDEAGFWNEALTVNDDGEYFARVALAAGRIIFVSDALGLYRLVPRSLSSQKVRSATESQLEACRLSVAALLAHDDSPRSRIAAATLFARFVHATYPRASDLTAAAEREIQKLGGSSLRPSGGFLFRCASGMLGWKAATILRGSVRDLFALSVSAIPRHQ